MAVEVVGMESHGKLDAKGYDPRDVVKCIPAFTGRASGMHRDEDHINEIVESFLAEGQIVPFQYRKDDDGKMVVLSGTTRILAAVRITERGLTSKNSDPRKRVTYGPDQPFIIYGLYKRITEAESYAYTIHENTRKPLTDVDNAFIIETLYESCGKTYEEIAEIFHKELPWVMTRVRVLELPDSILQLVGNDNGQHGDYCADINPLVKTMAAVKESDRKGVIEYAKQIVDAKAAEETPTKDDNEAEAQEDLFATSDTSVKRGRKAKAQNANVTPKAKKLTGTILEQAVRETGVDTIKPLRRPEVAFNSWVGAMKRKTEPGPALNFLDGYERFKAGEINEDTLTSLFRLATERDDEFEDNEPLHVEQRTNAAS